MPEVNGVTIKISGDSSDVIKELERVSKSLDGMKNAEVKITIDSSQAVSEVQKVSSSIDSVESSSAKIIVDGSQAVSEAERVSDAIKNLGGSNSEILADGSQAIDEAEKVTETIQGITDGHIDITADSSQAINEAEKVSDAISEIKTGETEITADGSQAISEAERVQAVIDLLQGKQLNINIKFPYEEWQNDFNKKFTGPIVAASRNAAEKISKTFKENFKEAAEAADNLSEHFESGFGAVLLGIGAKIGAIVTGLTTTISSALLIGGGFEAQMTSVKVISGATGKELDELTKKAREMGAALPISAKDAATAMTMLAQRGTQAKDILTTVGDVANLSISQGVDMGTAADMLGSTLTNFGLAMEDASKVTAIFNNASNQSAMNISKMVEALKYVGPTAGSVGMELTEAMSAMEALANAGLTGEMIGTGLAGVLTKLASKTQILGVQTQDAQGKIRPLAEIFTELQAKGFSLAEATTAFGARGRLAALNLAKQSASLKENEEKLKQWGSTQAAVDEKAKTFPNTMAAFRSAIEELHIEIFEQIKDKSKDVVSAFADITRSFSKWLEETKLAQKVIHGFIQGLGLEIPTGADFQRILDSLDVDMIVEKFRGFGSAMSDLASAVIRVKDVIETPLEFLIDHMETFAKMTFWGWILDMSLSVPAALLRLGSSIMGFSKNLATLLGLNLTGILPFFKSLGSLLASPAFMSIMGLGTVAVFSAKKIFDYVDAQKELEAALYEEKKYLQKQADADNTLDLDIKLNFKTGFEKLPKSWAIASDELRAKANADLKELQDQFRAQVGEAVTGVIAKFPDMTEELTNFANNLSNSDLRQLTKALQGSKEIFDELPEPIKKVVEQLYYMDVRAGQAKESLGNLLIEQKKVEHSLETGGKPMRSEFQEYVQSLSLFANSLVENVPANFERLQSVLGDYDKELAINISLSGAYEELNKFAKETAKKLKTPEEIVKAGVLSQLKKLASQGNQTAQSLINGWNNSGSSLDNFMQKANDAISYLGASPVKFLPALNSLTRGLQKIDPLTGKVTEQFKKAHDTLKQWASVTFDQLSARIQRLRRAVEGGFINKKALEREADDLIKQITIKVNSEMEPTRGTYNSQSDYNAVLASEVFTKAQEMGGQVLVDYMQKKFPSIGATTGASMGQALLLEIQRGNSSSSSIKISGNTFTNLQPMQMQKEPGTITQTLTDLINPMVAKIEQMNTSPVQQMRDYTGNIAQVVKEIQNLSAGITTLNATSQANITAINLVEAAVKSQNPEGSGNINAEIQNLSGILSTIQSIQQTNSGSINEAINAIRSIENALKSLSTGNNYDIDIIQQGFNVMNKSDADYAARSVKNALQSGIGNGVI